VWIFESRMLGGGGGGGGFFFNRKKGKEGRKISKWGAGFLRGNLFFGGRGGGGGGVVEVICY